MNIHDIITPNGERPLDHIVNDGGFCGIFKSIACIGDSFASGEFQSLRADGIMGHHDMYEYSWGQCISRILNCKAYNFSMGGMTAKKYYESFADAHGFFDKELIAQCYIIALGYNDLINADMPIGACKDFDCVNISFLSKDEQSFAYYLSKIILKYKEISPKAKFFFMTMPREAGDTPEIVEKKNAHAKLLHSLTDIFSNSYVLDFRKYAPEYDEEFKEKFFLYGHMNACGYLLTAKMVISYIDYIIRNNIGDFKNVSFITTDKDCHKF